MRAVLEDVYKRQDVDTKNEVCTYGSSDSKDRIAWDFEADFDDLDEMYTRYPSSSSSSSDDELTNGKSITESNVEKYLSEFEDDRDSGDGKEWDDDDEDFAWSLSDEIFGDVDYTKHSKTSKLKIGDIIYDDDEGLYGVVIDIDEDRERAYYVSVYSCLLYTSRFFPHPPPLQPDVSESRLLLL